MASLLISARCILASVSIRVVINEHIRHIALWDDVRRLGCLAMAGSLGPIPFKVDGASQ